MKSFHNTVEKPTFVFRLFLSLLFAFFRNSVLRQGFCFFVLRFPLENPLRLVGHVVTHGMLLTFWDKEVEGNHVYYHEDDHAQVRSWIPEGSDEEEVRGNYDTDPCEDLLATCSYVSHRSREELSGDNYGNNEQLGTHGSGTQNSNVRR